MATGTIQKTLTGLEFVEETISVSFSAGTVGTRGLQKQLDHSAPSGKKIIGTAITYISDSSKMSPLLFTTGSALYCNVYRADSSELSSGSVTVRFVFADA